MWKGLVAARRVWEGKYPLLFGRCCGAVVMTSSKMTVRGNFEGGGGMVKINLYGDVFCHTFEQLFEIWSWSGRGKMQNGGEINQFPPR